MAISAPPKWLHRTSHPGVLLPRQLQATTDGRGLGGAHGATFFDHARHRQLRRSARDSRQAAAGRPPLRGDRHQERRARAPPTSAKGRETHTHNLRGESTVNAADLPRRRRCATVLSFRHPLDITRPRRCLDRRKATWQRPPGERLLPCLITYNPNNILYGSGFHLSKGTHTRCDRNEEEGGRTTLFFWSSKHARSSRAHSPDTPAHPPVLGSSRGGSEDVKTYGTEVSEL